MTDYLKARYNLDDPEFVSVIDEAPLWSVPFGLRILDVIRYQKGIKALDIGFGSGFPLIELAIRLGNSSKVYGIDPWKAAIERTKKKLKYYSVSNVELSEGIAERMPFGDGCFDLIVSNNGINNVQDIEKTFGECRRVAKTGANFVFTFNTDKTFIEFYDVFRGVLRENGLQRFNDNISEHIYQKRKPMIEIKKLLIKSGFRVLKIYRDLFHYRFSDGTAMLNDYFIKYGFMESWKKIIPERYLVKIFKQIESKLNTLAAKKGSFSMRVPFVTIVSEAINIPPSPARRYRVKK